MMKYGLILCFDTSPRAAPEETTTQVNYNNNYEIIEVKGDNKIDDENAYAIVKFISHQNVIAKVIEEDELAELRKDPENDVNFI